MTACPRAHPVQREGSRCCCSFLVRQDGRQPGWADRPYQNPARKGLPGKEEDVIPRILARRPVDVPAAVPSAPHLPLARLSIHQTTTPCWSLAEAVDAYERAGAAGIGVHLPKLEMFGRDRAVRLLNRSPLRVSSLGWAGGFTGDHDQTFHDAVEEATDVVLLASAIGAQAVHLLSGTVGGHIQSHARRLLIEGLQELAGVARQENVRLAVQPMHRIFEREWSFLSGIDQTLEVLSRFSPEQVGLAFGTYHFWEEERLLERVRELTPWIASVQLSDWRQPPRCDNDRLLPGDGIIPLGEIVGEIERCGYRGCYELEVWSRDLWKLEPHGLIHRAVERFLDLPVVVPA